jgi:hypothetical protein
MRSINEREALLRDESARFALAEPQQASCPRCLSSAASGTTLACVSLLISAAAEFQFVLIAALEGARGCALKDVLQYRLAAVAEVVGLPFLY